MPNTINITTTTNISGIFYRDEMGYPLCPRCVAEQYPASHGLLMEVCDVEDAEPIMCDGCGEDILPCNEENEEF